MLTKTETLHHQWIWCIRFGIPPTQEKSNTSESINRQLCVCMLEQLIEEGCQINSAVKAVIRKNSEGGSERFRN